MGLWDPKWDPKNSGCLAGTQGMGGASANDPLISEQVVKA